jgi:acetolactate synthase-1/2/3 large subunit
MPSAAQSLVETLRLHGVDRIFCVPGESYLAVLDALVDAPDINVVACRHEGGAGFAAVADAKLTGRAGVCFVSRGPGATNAAIAVHTAAQDAAPLVLFVGQVERKDLGRDAFQEVDYAKTFSDMAKWVCQAHEPDRLPELAARAFAIAESGTPGPVVVALPEDMLEQPCAGPALAPGARPRAYAAEADIGLVAERLARAERPVLIGGGLLKTPGGKRALLALSEAWALPVAGSFKHQDLFPNAHPNFAGHLGYGIPPQLAEAMGEADLVLAVGTRLGDVTSQGFTLPRPGQALIHVYPDPDRIGRVFPVERGIVSEPAAFVEALAARNAPPRSAARAAWNARLHKVHADLAKWAARPAEDGVEFGHMARAMIDQLPDDAIMVMDAGNFSGWAHRYFPFGERHDLIGCVTGAMGMGAPGALAAALRHPERQTVALIGDGGFLMTGAELATAVKEKARVRLIVANNGCYGTIRLHQEKRRPGRAIATDLANPDFAALARAYGAKGLSVQRPADCGPALAEALAHNGPAVIDVAASLENISAYVTLSKLRQR